MNKIINLFLLIFLSTPIFCADAGEDQTPPSTKPTFGPDLFDITPLILSGLDQEGLMLMSMVSKPFQNAIAERRVHLTVTLDTVDDFMNICKNNKGFPFQLNSLSFKLKNSDESDFIVPCLIKNKMIVRNIEILSLDFSSSKLVDLAGLLKVLPNLRELHLKNAVIGDLHVNAMAALNNLQVLTLFSHKAWSFSLVQKICALPNLRVLKFLNFSPDLRPSWDSEQLSFQCPLESFELRGFEIPHSFGLACASLTNLRNLNVIGLKKGGRFNSEFAQSLLENNPLLEELDFTFSDINSDVAVLLSQRFPHYLSLLPDTNSDICVTASTTKDPHADIVCRIHGGNRDWVAPLLDSATDRDIKLTLDINEFELVKSVVSRLALDVTSSLRITISNLNYEVLIRRNQHHSKIFSANPAQFGLINKVIEDVDGIILHVDNLKDLTDLNLIEKKTKISCLTLSPSKNFVLDAEAVAILNQFPNTCSVVIFTAKKDALHVDEKALPHLNYLGGLNFKFEDSSTQLSLQFSHATDSGGYAGLVPVISIKTTDISPCIKHFPTTLNFALNIEVPCAADDLKQILSSTNRIERLHISESSKTLVITEQLAKRILKQSCLSFAKFTDCSLKPIASNRLADKFSVNIHKEEQHDEIFLTSLHHCGLASYHNTGRVSVDSLEEIKRLPKDVFGLEINFDMNVDELLSLVHLSKLRFINLNNKSTFHVVPELAHALSKLPECNTFTINGPFELSPGCFAELHGYNLSIQNTDDRKSLSFNRQPPTQSQQASCSIHWKKDEALYDTLINVSMLPDLQYLHVYGDVELDQRAVGIIKKITTLKSINFFQPKGSCCGHFKYLSHLKQILLYMPEVNDEEFSNWRRDIYPQLRDLKNIHVARSSNNSIILLGQGVTDESLAILANEDCQRNPFASSLSVIDSSITDVTLGHIAKLCGLTKLDLSGSNAISVDGVMSIITSCTSLCELILPKQFASSLEAFNTMNEELVISLEE